VVADKSKLMRTITELVESQPDDQRLRDHLEGTQRDEQFPSLTWFWGPLLYDRNRAVFRSVILSNFSDWELGIRWRRIKWSKHQDRLQPWLDAARANRDTVIVRRLLRWKFAAKKWGIDQKAWNAALLQDYLGAETAAARAIVLDEYDDWFEFDEDTSLKLYERDQGVGDFILKHLPRTFWGGEKRKLWQRLYRAAKEAGDTKLQDKLYQSQIPFKEWQANALLLASQIQDPAKLCDELDRHHPIGWGLDLGKGMIELLKARGRDVMPYVRRNLKVVVGGWYGKRADPMVKLAKEKGWWDLWAALIRTDRNPKRFNAAVASLVTSEPELSEDKRVTRLQSLAGVSREFNWPGFGFVMVHALDDDIAVSLYERYPELIHGGYKAHVTPRWSRGYPQLLKAARNANDEELVDLLASRYVTQVRYGYGYTHHNKKRDAMILTADSLADYYQAIRERDPEQFARRAANVLTRVPAFVIYNYNNLLDSNKLARLLFVRSFDSYLASPSAVRDLVEGSEIHVQMLAYRVLSQDDDRARDLALDALDILIGTLLRPLHRKTRTAAFGALLNAAKADSGAADHILTRAREALRLPDKRYPKEELIGLLGKILHARPEHRSASEQPIVYGLEEATA